MKQKRLFSLSLIISLIFCLFLIVGCSTSNTETKSNENTNTENISQETNTSNSSGNENSSNEKDLLNEVADKPSEINEDENKILVAYFSETGNTQRIANIIAEHLPADEFEIIPTQPYTTDDLDYNNPESRTYKEHEDLSLIVNYIGKPEPWDQYDTVFIGFPVWYGDAPNIVYEFMGDYYFTDKTIIPFCTSGETGIETIELSLSNCTYEGDWVDGKRFSGDASEEEVVNWITSLEDDGYLKY